MKRVEMEAENDKATKNFDRYKFGEGSINGSIYLPKGTNKVEVSSNMNNEYNLNI